MFRVDMDCPLAQKPPGAFQEYAGKAYASCPRVRINGYSCNYREELMVLYFMQTMNSE